jgi:hypothetical protein
LSRVPRGVARTVLRGAGRGNAPGLPGNLGAPCGVGWCPGGSPRTARVQHAWVVDPNRVRNFRAGQAAWIYGNACTYVPVAPYRRPPLALPARQQPPARHVEPVARPVAVEAAPGQWVGPEVPLPGGVGVTGD